MLRIQRVLKGTQEHFVNLGAQCQDTIDRTFPEIAIALEEPVPEFTRSGHTLLETCLDAQADKVGKGAVLKRVDANVKEAANLLTN